MIKKILLSTLFLFSILITKSQTMICWKWELAKVNMETRAFEVVSKVDLNSEAFFSNKYIRINDAKILLTIENVMSIIKKEEGTTTIYNVSDENGYKWIASIISDLNGIFKMMLTQNINSSESFIFTFKNR